MLRSLTDLPFQKANRFLLQDCQRFTHHCAGALDVFPRVRCGNKSGLELRRRKINAALQASMEKLRKHFQVAPLRTGKIDNRSRGKKQTKH